MKKALLPMFLMIMSTLPAVAHAGPDSDSDDSQGLKHAIVRDVMISGTVLSAGGLAAERIGERMMDRAVDAIAHRRAERIAWGGRGAMFIGPALALGASIPYLDDMHVEITACKDSHQLQSAAQASTGENPCTNKAAVAPQVKKPEEPACAPATSGASVASSKGNALAD